jgi:general secretion pathway protein K
MPRRQRGAALLTAMIIVTLVATLAAAMVWQQWRAVQVESAERARAQAAWMLSGGLDFALLILKEAVPPGRPTTLTDTWTTPLAESRLSTFLAVDKANAADGPEAFLSGDITDAQARYNLHNLVAKIDPKQPFTIVPVEFQTLERLCVLVGVGTGIARTIADGMVEAANLAPSARLQPTTVAQLTWFGIDPATVQALQPYVTLLPQGTGLNVNTAPKEVLAAVIDGDAEGLVRLRQRTPFDSTRNDFRAQAGLQPNAPLAAIATTSNNFVVRARLRLEDRVLVERSLVQRNPNTNVFVPIHSERIASLDQPGG